ncbi:MAG: response regulator [Eubacteriaceae bacterium]|nr:response regulator [Eubacteriaceae bacterium]
MQLKVAIAEDNRKDLMKIKMMCEREFFSVLTARDGNEMKDMIDDYLPDVIITDLVMPLSHGIDVTKYSRSKRHYAPIVIVISEIKTQKYINLAFDSGADYFMEKPVDMNRLREVLLEISRICNIKR